MECSTAGWDFHTSDGHVCFITHAYLMPYSSKARILGILAILGPGTLYIFDEYLAMIDSCVSPQVAERVYILIFILVSSSTLTW